MSQHWPNREFEFDDHVFLNAVLLKTPAWVTALPEWLALSRPSVSFHERKVCCAKWPTAHDPSQLHPEHCAILASARELLIPWSFPISDSMFSDRAFQAELHRISQRQRRLRNMSWGGVSTYTCIRSLSVWGCSCLT